MSKRYDFEDVTLLITHYNRSSSLRRLVDTLHDLECSFGDIVVSDDGSAPPYLQEVRRLADAQGFRLVESPVNKGLGNNINKGQSAVKTAYTLYIQEDFIPSNQFPEKLSEALVLLRTDPETDIIRFYAYFKYPYLKPVKGGFSEMLFRWYYPGYRKFYQYSDHPHLRRTSFPDKFGDYVEGEKGDATEYKKMMTFLIKNGKGLFYEDFNALFRQANSEEEPSTMTRVKWRESNHPLIALTRHIYRYLKFYADYWYLQRRNQV